MWSLCLAAKRILYFYNLVILLGYVSGITIWSQFFLGHDLSFQYVNSSLLLLQENVLELYFKYLFHLTVLVIFFGDTNYAYIGFLAYILYHFQASSVLSTVFFLSYPPHLFFFSEKNFYLAVQFPN